MRTNRVHSFFLKNAQEASVNPASKSFTPDITPLILASHKDNYEIIKILLDRGEQIPEPVRPLNPDSKSLDPIRGLKFC